MKRILQLCLTILPAMGLAQSGASEADVDAKLHNREINRVALDTFIDSDGFVQIRHSEYIDSTLIHSYSLIITDTIIDTNVYGKLWWRNSENYRLFPYREADVYIREGWETAVGSCLDPIGVFFPLPEQ